MTMYSGEIPRGSLWDRVLSPAEVDWLFNDGEGRRYEDLSDEIKVGLVLWWEGGEVVHADQKGSC